MISPYDHHAPALRPRASLPRPGPVPDVRLEALLRPRNPSVVARSPDSSTSTSSSQSGTISCGPKDTTGPCERMVSASASNTTIPIALGVVIPLTVAFVVLVFLHRRHVKKLRREDAEDANKSLDFGMDGSVMTEKRRNKKGGKKIPEMSVTEAQGAVRGDRGVSLDLGVSNPYLLPPELQQSRESLHSLSRSINTGDDKYRATTFIPDDGSIRSPSSLKSHWDDSSTTYTSSSRKRLDTESTKGLLQPVVKINEPLPTIRKPLPVAKDNNSLLAPGLQDSARDSYLSTTSSNGAVAALRASNNYLGAFISGGAANKSEESLQKPEVVTSVVELEGSVLPQEPAAAVLRNEQSQRKSPVTGPTAGFNFNIPSGPQELPAHEPVTYHELATQRDSTMSHQDKNIPEIQLPKRRQSSVYEDNLVGLAQPPLQTMYTQPVESSNTHLLEQNDQQRQPTLPDVKIDAVRTHEDDYYEEDTDDFNLEEYRDVLGYDPRLLSMGQRPLPPDDPSENPEERALRIRSFYKEYFDDSAKPAGATGRVSYYDGSENYIDDYYGTYNSQGYGSRGPSRVGQAHQGRHRATISNGTYHGPRTRAFSSASGRMQPRRPGPQKKLPPPAPLLVLPTPSKLHEDSMLPNAIDFAPPQMFKNQRAGIRNSLKGGSRPYSPSTRAYNPLVSSFDDLAVLPSPHQLRKSGTFTSLDFAPPRFAAAEGNGSETGSIRSNRSGVSALHQHNIRNGAYRVSRIPREVAGTKNELSDALRPQWDMNR